MPTTVALPATTIESMVVAGGDAIGRRFLT
jgi:hypothetical protein